MIFMAFVAVVLYTLIGFIPGTDETSVLMPITLAVILAGTPPIVVLSFFIAAIVTLNLVNAIPTALVGLPGGVMSSPMLEHSLYLKSEGKSALVVKKMAVGSLIGTIIAIPVSLLLAGILAPFGDKIKDMAPLLLFLGAIFLSLISKNRILSLISIIPMAILFMSLRHLYWGIGVVPEGINITTSFFLGITIGPLIVSLFNLLNNKNRSLVVTENKKMIFIPSDNELSKTLNPFKILTKEEIRSASIGAIIANFLFVLSPVGLTILFGEALSNGIKDPVKKSTTAITTMSALAQSTYLSGIIIPLMAIGIPLSPTSIGPGGALFNAPPFFSLENNIHHLLSKGEFIAAILIGSVIAVSITYVITNRFASTISAFVLKKIPHEAILGLFISFIFLLAYMDAGIINIFGVLLIGICCGTLNKMGVNYGIQFMTLYAAPFIIEKIILF
jgi:hypothetical protein